jgi:hypothetical protein
MFGSDAIEVAIGVIFFWLLLSLVCSAGNELIASWLGWRAKDLEAGLHSLLGEKKGESKMVDRIYNHPLVGALSRDGQRPSYLPSRAFALALMDELATISNSPAGQVALGVLDVEKRDQALSQMRATIAGIDDGVIGIPLKRALLTAIGSTGDDVDKVQHNIEAWFNDSMERVSGWYKQRTQWALLVMAFVFTMLMNLDTITIVDTLGRNPTLRQTLVQAAAQQVGQPPAGSASLATPYEKLTDDLDKIQSLGWPVGWSFPRDTPQSIGGGINKVVGLLLTTLAASLGAPFWFDVLNKIVRLRTSLKPAYDEPAKG